MSGGIAYIFKSNNEFRSDNFNMTVSGYDPSAKLPRTIPPWNPTKMEIGNFKGGWSQKKDKIKIPQEFPNHKY